MKKSVEYEIKSLPELQKFITTLKEKISEPIIVKKADEGNSLQISTEQRDLRVQIFPLLTETLTESYKIEVLTQWQAMKNFGFTFLSYTVAI